MLTQELVCLSDMAYTWAKAYTSLLLAVQSPTCCQKHNFQQEQNTTECIQIVPILNYLLSEQIPPGTAPIHYRLYSAHKM